jgi:hypothetical protein
MATGTAAGLLDAAGPQAVYKRAILEAYIDRFTVTTTKPAWHRSAHEPGRCVENYSTAAFRISCAVAVGS